MTDRIEYRLRHRETGAYIEIGRGQPLAYREKAEAERTKVVHDDCRIVRVRIRSVPKPKATLGVEPFAEVATTPHTSFLRVAGHLFGAKHSAHAEELVARINAAYQSAVERAVAKERLACSEPGWWHTKIGILTDERDTLRAEVRRMHMSEARAKDACDAHWEPQLIAALKARDALRAQLDKVTREKEEAEADSAADTKALDEARDALEAVTKERDEAKAQVKAMHTARKADAEWRRYHEDQLAAETKRASAAMQERDAATKRAEEAELHAGLEAKRADDARAVAIEECARVAESHAPTLSSPVEHMMAMDERRTATTIAQRIRALASSPVVQLTGGLDGPPPARREVRGEVERFAQLMESQLAANDHKGGWENESASELLERLREEVGELDEALAATMMTPTQIGREAADVANFAMMIADVSGGLQAWAKEGT